MFARIFPSLAAVMIAGFAASTVGVAGQAPPPAPPAQSAAPTKELIQLLTAKKLTAIAAKDPVEPERYVAALNVPGVELLVISAKADPQTLEYRLFHKDYATAYGDINASADPAKLFVTDQRADGLVARPPKDSPLDSIVQAGKEFAFDGDPKKLKVAKMLPQDFDKRFADADEAYTHILKMLIAELKKD